MSNIKNYKIGDAVLSNNNISVKKTIFGLSSKAVYSPTDSPVKAYRSEYNVENGRKLEQIINTPVDRLHETVADSQIQRAPIGNMLLEYCLSKDGKFAAVQLFQFSDLRYQPISDVKFYEGKSAELLASVI